MARILVVEDEAVIVEVVRDSLAGTEHEGGPPTVMTDVPAHLRGRQGLFDGVEESEEAVG